MVYCISSPKLWPTIGSEAQGTIPGRQAGNDREAPLLDVAQDAQPVADGYPLLGTVGGMADGG